MSSLVLLFVLAVTVDLAFADLEPPQSEIEEHPEADEEDRSGAYAHASVNVRQVPGFGPGPGFGPRPGPGQRPIPGPRPGPYIPVKPQSGMVECYACVDCPHVSYNTTTRFCPLVLDGSRRASCVAYAEKYKQLKKTWYVRGCAQERGTCSDIRQAHGPNSDVVKLLSCQECDGERCNISGAPRSLSDFTIAIFSLLVTPLVAKFTLS